MSDKNSHQFKQQYQELNIGQRIRFFRQAKKLSLAQLCVATAISEATLSRLENEQTSISTQHLYALSCALEIEMSAFFAPKKQMPFLGSRAVDLAGDREYVDLQHFSSALLCTQLQDKHMLPVINHINASSLSEAGELQSHEGEEFIYVLKGAIEIHTQAYKPQCLSAGDCIYFDANMAHAYVNVHTQTSQVLVVNTADTLNK